MKIRRRVKHKSAILIAAHSAGKSIAVDGTNTCTRWGDGEDVDTMRLHLGKAVGHHFINVLKKYLRKTR